ncbi:hypothetical protein C7S20_16790 [Christiangramia fulva]|uniref:RiboL-PSP-HEPN domain-containing protein n=1 Tax=Christiangramia fulva TaxID=2126553 RepID=A0A2R3Z940_9FLAO|nr:MAE_28990/MAE_18760 family HEPN-like nuclease [Christiangramia fulva]AVR46785.1 hypothetical protein C7S20_16790 [Christiangramia fulva]
MGKNVITFDQLTDKIIADFSWRRKELTVLKSKIPNTKNPLQTAMIRATMPLLYAHWEGFVKISLSYYLEYVSNKGLKHDELKNQFVALSLQKKLGTLQENSIESKTQIIDFIFDKASKQSNIPTKNVINTKSNLKYHVLEEILFIMDLKDVYFESQKDLVDDLVDERNHIAHGEHKLVDYDTFIEFHDDIIALMEYLKTKIENSAVLESYKKPAPNTASSQITG